MYELLSSRAVLGMLARSLGAMTTVPWVARTSWLNTNTNSDSETYAWAGLTPGMRRFLGDRVAHQLEEQGMRVPNLEYELTLEFLRRELMRDKTGSLDARIRGMTAVCGDIHWAELLTELMLEGATSVASRGAEATYDKANFFGNGHRGSQDNTVSQAAASGIVPTVSEMKDLLKAIVDKFLTITDEHGRPANETMTDIDLVVPAALNSVAVAAIQLDVLQGVGGPVQSELKPLGMNWRVHSNARLDHVDVKDKVFAFRGDGQGAQKPFVRQEEEGLRVGSAAGGSETEFMQNRHLYGVMASRGVGYFLWEHAVEGTIT